MAKNTIPCCSYKSKNRQPFDAKTTVVYSLRGQSVDGVHVVVPHVSTLGGLVLGGHGERELLAHCIDRQTRWWSFEATATAIATGQAKNEEAEEGDDGGLGMLALEWFE